jgi:hypothetical protein
VGKVATEQTGEAVYPAAWIFDEDGATVAGTFVKFDQGRTKEYGKKVICVLEVGGVERSVWLSQMALFSKFKDELESRPSKTLQPGERVVVQRGAEKVKGKTSDRSYWPFVVAFPDAPERSTSDLFGGFDEGHVKYDEQEGNVDEQGEIKSEPDDGDEIPF